MGFSGLKSSVSRTEFFLEGLRKKPFPSLLQLLEVARIPWLMAPSFIFRESGVLLSLMVAGKEFCRQLVPTWIIQLLSQLQAFNFITSRVDSDCFGFIPGLRSFLPEAAPAPGSCPPQRQRIWGLWQLLCQFGSSPFSSSALWGRGSGHCYHPHFTDGQTEAQTGQTTCPRPYSWQGAGLNLGDGWILNQASRGPTLLPGMWSFSALRHSS